jgi:hypothetical protein
MPMPYTHRFSLSPQPLRRTNMKITILTSILFWLAAMTPTSSVGSVETHTFKIVGTDAPVGGIDPFSEGSTVSAAGPWGPTHSLGHGHPWQDKDGVIAPSWINVYPSLYQGLNTVSWVRIRFTMPTEFSNASFNLKMKNDNKDDVSIIDNFLATISGYVGLVPKRPRGCALERT